MLPLCCLLYNSLLSAHQQSDVLQIQSKPLIWNSFLHASGIGKFVCNLDYLRQHKERWPLWSKLNAEKQLKDIRMDSREKTK